MIVYRYEAKNGYGPNCGNDTLWHRIDRRHPMNFYYVPDDFVFACPSLEALHRWFSREDRRDMRRDNKRANLGYRLCAYRVAKKYTALDKSGKQIIFSKRVARLLWATPVPGDKL